MSEPNTTYDFSPSPVVGLGACGRAPTHPEEIERLVRDPINQARLRIGALVINSQSIGANRQIHRQRCGCRDYEGCTTPSARHLRDATIKASLAEIEIRNFLDMARGTGAAS